MNGTNSPEGNTGTPGDSRLARTSVAFGPRRDVTIKVYRSFGASASRRPARRPSRPAAEFDVGQGDAGAFYQESRGPVARTSREKNGASQTSAETPLRGHGRLQNLEDFMRVPNLPDPLRGLARAGEAVSTGAQSATKSAANAADAATTLAQGPPLPRPMVASRRRTLRPPDCSARLPWLRSRFPVSHQVCRIRRRERWPTLPRPSPASR